MALAANTVDTNTTPSPGASPTFSRSARYVALARPSTRNSSGRSRPACGSSSRFDLVDYSREGIPYYIQVPGFEGKTSKITKAARARAREKVTSFEWCAPTSGKPPSSGERYMVTLYVRGSRKFRERIYIYRVAPGRVPYDRGDEIIKVNLP